MKKKCLALLVSVSAAMGSIAMAAPANAGENPPAHVDSSLTAHDQEFDKCAGDSSPEVEARVTSLGSELGPGISQEVNKAELATINEGLNKAGRSQVPEETVALRYLDTGETVAVDESGEALVYLDDAAEGPTMTTFSVGDEIKKVVGGCLGVGVVGGTTWKALGEDVLVQLTRWDTAVKFVVRRVGLLGAVSCMGGIVWQYI